MFRVARSLIRNLALTNYLNRTLLRENGEIIVETSSFQLRQIPEVCCSFLSEVLLLAPTGAQELTLSL